MPKNQGTCLKKLAKDNGGSGRGPSPVMTTQTFCCRVERSRRRSEDSGDSSSSSGPASGEGDLKAGGGPHHITHWDFTNTDRY